jgi:chaperonin GroES
MSAPEHEDFPVADLERKTIEAFARKIGDEAFAPAPLSLGDLIDPMPGKIAVQIETKKEWTPSGLFIPLETARTVHDQRATQGKVVAIGESDDDLESPGIVALGDTVLFGKYTGTKISWQPDRKAERQDVIIMQERDVLAVLRSPDQARNIKVRT